MLLALSIAESFSYWVRKAVLGISVLVNGKPLFRFALFRRT